MPETAAVNPGQQDVLTWLLAQYAETEEAASEAALDDVPGWREHQGRVIGTDPRFDSLIIGDSAEPTPCQRWHIVRNDPQTVLAETAAKQTIIAELLADTTPAGQQRAARVIQHLAAALAHRPGYRTDWQPPETEHEPPHPA